MNKRPTDNRNGAPERGDQSPDRGQDQQPHRGPGDSRSDDPRSDASRSSRSQVRGRSQTGALYEEIARLHATIQSLRATGETLEAECRRLLEENQKLRRQATLSAYADDLDLAFRQVGREEEASENSDAGAKNAAGPQASSLLPIPPQAERFYRQLPGRFTFPSFFHLAEAAGLGKRPARRCLMHYLVEELLVQSGAYLEKVDVGGDGGRPR
jgi:hypothetical protein